MMSEVFIYDEFHIFQCSGLLFVLHLGIGFLLNRRYTCFGSECYKLRPRRDSLSVVLDYCTRSLNNPLCGHFLRPYLRNPSTLTKHRIHTTSIFFNTDTFLCILTRGFFN